MKKLILILTVLITVTIKVNAQIPNSGFENWNTVVNVIEPVSWHSMYSLTGSTGSYCPVTKSTDHYPATIGSFSVKIANDTARWKSGISPGNMLGWGMLTSTQMNDKPLFHVSGHPKSLCGYYKFLPKNGDTMSIAVHFYKNSVEITSGNFKSNVAVSNWTSFKVFVSDTLYSSVDSARIAFSACNEPKGGNGGPRGNSVLYIDNLNFDNPVVTGLSDFEETNTVSVYPNPANDKLTISFADNSVKLVDLKIFNAFGKQVFTQDISDNTRATILDISKFKEGIYFICTTSEKQMIYVKKIIIMK